ncbi:hypothetical protein OIE13_04495 [Streptosporangium sp. NBC_01810]|uniref:hypothetical protein n=1 Tax=Streptosporangium sp. NBC_01810 TaxID=2975951 RepID=UPI002DD96203|nr:hypothetical protein [Streptosporangium sp. NBC_01810]WSA27150.1 hypothetical protein OIE13_04495 [Streptosporangium sp. NBC_01810]
MASEQSSQSHLPPAWPEAAEPPPPWTNDPLGTGPRLPHPQEEPQGGNGSWQTSPGVGGQRDSDPQTGSPGQTSPGGNGWAQASDPQNSGWAQASASQNDGWAQATGPQNNTWAQAGTPTHDGWAQASDPQNNGWAQATGPQNDGWAQATGPQNNTWAQAGTPTHDGWAQASDPQNNTWAQAGTPTHDGWAQASDPQNNTWAQAGTPTHDGWAQASDPQNNGWAQATGPQNDTWAQASTPQNDTWAQAFSPRNDNWAQASTPQGGDDRHQTSPGNGWPQPTPSQGGGWSQTSGPQGGAGDHNPSSPGNGWPQPTSTPQADPRGQTSSGGSGWAQATAPSHDGWAQAATPQNDGRTHASGPQGDGQGQRVPGTTGEAWQAAPPRDASGRPPAQTAENSVWPPTPPAENAAWPPTPPAAGATWPPTSPMGNPGSAEAQTSTFSWVAPPSEGSAAHFGDASSGAAPGAPGTSPEGGDRTGAGNARRSYGVPDNPAMWAMAAANAAAASQAPSPQGTSVHPGAGPQAPQTQPGQPQHPGQPGHHLSRDPSDPNRPFVTAGQISGPKTPPPERQQELWNTVFGDNYRDIEDELEERGRPVWIFALAGSVIIALVGVVLWAFLAGPLASSEEEIAEPKPATTAPKKTSKPAAIGRLPRFTGDPSPVAGTLTDQSAGITLAQLGAPWRQDQRPSVPTTYGFTTRQYLPAGTDSTGKAQYAQLMSGPLSPRLKSRYTSPENLAPVINAVASTGRKRFFPEDNTARKTAQQTLSVNGLPGQLAAYEITSGDSKTIMVVAAVSTGADLPAIVYMSVPDSKKEMLPDINTVFKSIRVAGR